MIFLEHRPAVHNYEKMKKWRSLRVLMSVVLKLFRKKHRRRRGWTPPPSATIGLKRWVFVLFLLISFLRVKTLQLDKKMFYRIKNKEIYKPTQIFFEPFKNVKSLENPNHFQVILYLSFYYQMSPRSFLFSNVNKIICFVIHCFFSSFL